MKISKTRQEAELMFIKLASYYIGQRKSRTQKKMVSVDVCVHWEN